MLNVMIQSSRVAVIAILVVQGQTVMAQQCKNGTCTLRHHQNDLQLTAPTPRRTPSLNSPRPYNLERENLKDPFSNRPSENLTQNLRPTAYPTRYRQDDSFRQAIPSAPMRLTWEKDIHKGARAARAEGQPLLIRVTADWCGYCRKMKSEVFSLPNIQKDLAQGFVTVELNADENRELVERLGVKSLPATLILTPDMQIAERMEGFRSAEQLQEKLNRFLPRAELIRDITIALR